MAEYNIALVKGDGIGPDIIDEAVAVLNEIGSIYGHKFNFTEAVAGGCAIDLFGEPLPQSAVDICLNSDSVMLGAVGGPKWDNLPGHLRPEQALLGLRSILGLYCKHPPPPSSSPAGVMSAEGLGSARRGGPGRRKGTDRRFVFRKKGAAPLSIWVKRHMILCITLKKKSRG